MRSIVSIILFIIAASPAHAAKVREWVERGVLMIDVDLGRPTTVGMRNSGGEIYFQFSAEVGDNRALEQLETSRPQQLRDVQSGKNSLLLTGVEGASFQAWSTRNGVRVAVSGGGGQVTAPPRQAADDDHAVARRRLDVLRGRVELATGRPDVARQALEVARQRNPNDAETLTALAAAESELGRPNQALAYLDRAISARPDDPELARDRARILRDQAAYIEAYGGWRDTDDSDQESRTGVRIAARYGPKWRLGAEALVGHSRADAAQRTDGRIARVNDVFGSGEANIAYGWTPDQETEATLYGAEHGPGAGVTHRIGPVTARTTIRGVYAEPYFDDVAGVTDKGRQHAIQLRHDRRIDRDWQVGVGGGLYQYGVKGDDNVARSGGVTATVRRRLYSAAPFYVDAGYGLDAEYQIDIDNLRDAVGGTFNPLPIDDREVHFGDVSASAGLSETVSASATAGYGINRFGGDGATFAASVEWEPTANWKAGASAGYSFAATRGDDAAVTNIGVYLRRRLGANLAPPDATPTGALQ